MGFHINNVLILISIIIVFGGLAGNSMTEMEMEMEIELTVGKAEAERAAVPPSGSSPCTYIPGHNKGRCVVSTYRDKKGVAPPPPLPLPPPPPSFADYDNDVIPNSTS